MTPPWARAHIVDPLLGLTAAALAPRPRVEREPGWFFDKSELDNSFRTRQRRRIWRSFAERQVRRPVTIRWYDALRLRLYLGNDLSKCIFVGGSFEPNEFALIRDLLIDGMTFIDVGANEGVYSLYAAVRVGPNGRVVAVEPSSRELMRLDANVRRNRLANVTIVSAALGEAEGMATLAIAAYGHEGQNTIGSTVANPKVATERTETVSVRTLDAVVTELQLARVDYVKIDAEGSESLVLRGARQTLSKFRPVLQLELDDTSLRRSDASATSVAAQLEDVEYRIWVFDAESGLLRVSADETELVRNVIAAPKDWIPPTPHGGG